MTVITMMLMVWERCLCVWKSTGKRSWEQDLLEREPLQSTLSGFLFLFPVMKINVNEDDVLWQQWWQDIIKEDLRPLSKWWCLSEVWQTPGTPNKHRLPPWNINFKSNLGGMPHCCRLDFRCLLCCMTSFWFDIKCCIWFNLIPDVASPWPKLRWTSGLSVD